MKYKSSIRAELVRALGKLQLVSRKRNKAGKFVGKKRVVMRNKRINGKAGRFGVTQGNK